MEREKERKGKRKAQEKEGEREKEKEQERGQAKRKGKGKGKGEQRTRRTAVEALKRWRSSHHGDTFPPPHLCDTFQSRVVSCLLPLLWFCKRGNMLPSCLRKSGLEKATKVIESAQLVISIGSHDDTLLLCNRAGLQSLSAGWCGIWSMWAWFCLDLRPGYGR